MTTKECNKCLTVKELSEFPKKKTGKFGVKAQCKQCYNKISQEFYESNKEKIRDRAENYRDANRELVREQNRAYGARNRIEKREAVLVKYRKDNIKRKFNITPAEYDNYFECVDGVWYGVCGACGIRGVRKTGGMVLDHCHNSKKLRGVLCSNCNCALGLLKEDPLRLESLLGYLKHSKIVIG